MGDWDKITKDMIQQNPQPYAVLDQLYELEDKHLLDSIYTMSSLAYKHYQGAEPDWLVRKVKSMALDYEWFAEIPHVQRILKIGEEKGLEKGLEQGFQLGEAKGLEQGLERELAGLRELLLTLVNGRFPTLLPRVRTKASHANTPEVLQEVLSRLMLATTLEEAEQAVREWPRGGGTKSKKQDE